MCLCQAASTAATSRVLVFDSYSAEASDMDCQVMRGRVYCALDSYRLPSLVAAHVLQLYFLHTGMTYVSSGTYLSHVRYLSVRCLSQVGTQVGTHSDACPAPTLAVIAWCILSPVRYSLSRSDSIWLACRSSTLPVGHVPPAVWYQ